MKILKEILRFILEYIRDFLLMIIPWKTWVIIGFVALISFIISIMYAEKFKDTFKVFLVALGIIGFLIKKYGLCFKAFSIVFAMNRIA